MTLPPATRTGNTYDKYSSRHRVERALVARFLKSLDAAVAGVAPASIIEVGMGEGEIAMRLKSHFPKSTFAGIDLHAPDLAAHWVRLGLNGVVADARRLPFRDDSADLVLAIEVLEHVEDPAAALAEMARVGRGRVVLSVPLEPLWRVGNLLRRRYLSDLGNTPGHVNHFSRRGFVNLVEQHLEVRDVLQPLPWTMVVAEARAPNPKGA
ncbi:MAG TPA: class I SAM-dependent methyltransferase [Actinomycetota bacterium]|nr:class I SAM-dependent methyltransferase [Actinomycetota bacterium]